MDELIWWGFGWDTPLRQIGWSYVVLSWSAVFCIYLIIKNRRGWK